jgi:hypothetical protein
MSGAHAAQNATFASLIQKFQDPNFVDHLAAETGYAHLAQAPVPQPPLPTAPPVPQDTVPTSAAAERTAQPGQRPPGEFWFGAQPREGVWSCAESRGHWAAGSAAQPVAHARLDEVPYSRTPAPPLPTDSPPPDLGAGMPTSASVPEIAARPTQPTQQQQPAAPAMLGPPARSMKALISTVAEQVKQQQQDLVSKIAGCVERQSTTERELRAELTTLRGEVGAAADVTSQLQTKLRDTRWRLKAAEEALKKRLLGEAAQTAELENVTRIVQSGTDAAHQSEVCA